MDGASAKVNAEVNDKVEDSVESLRQRFVRQFGASPQIYQAPGRVKLIGEHTDYNDGFVMPAAIGFSTLTAIAEREGSRLCVRSENFAETVEFNIDCLPPSPRGHWSDYVLGVAVMLRRAGIELSGADLLIASDVPIGAGLSSSAA